MQSCQVDSLNLDVGVDISVEKSNYNIYSLMHNSIV